MKSGHLFLLLGICGAGLATGFAARRISGSTAPPADPAAAAASPDSKQDRPSRPGSPQSPDRRPGSQGQSKISHQDTIESLLALSPNQAYARTAAWLATAKVGEIQAFWEALSKTDDPGSNRHDLVDLTFLSWARIDPQGAIAAVKGSPDEHYAWWAWSAYDPAGAVAAATAENMDRLRNVTWGLGEFQPQWFREHYQELPQEARDNALPGLAKWGDSGNPAEMMDFLVGMRRFDSKTFTAWIQKDPLAAYDWITSKRNEQLWQLSGFSFRGGGNVNSGLEAIVSSLSETDPDSLQRLIDRAPAGEQKRQLESLVFQRLADSDPAAALKQAEETKGPKIASERLALLGTRALQENPDQALAIMHKILSINPSGLSNYTIIEYEGGASGSGNGNSSIAPLVDGLIAREPQKLLSQQIDSAGQPSSFGHESPFLTLAGKWADHDLDAFGDWVNQQSDPAVLKSSTNLMVQHLSQKQEFEAAAQWLQTLSPDDMRPSLNNLVFQWTQTAPDQAKEWLQNSNLSQQTKDEVSRNMEEILSNLQR